MKNNKQTGFTLYELLITVLIVGVILAMGIPNLRQFTQNSRMTSTANDLLSSFHLARSEAARAKSNITICASANSMMPEAECGGTWDQGYIVFVDTDGDISRSGPTETLLRANPALQEDVMLKVEDSANFFGFAATGLGRGDVGTNTALTRVVMCDDRGNMPAAGGNSAARVFVATPLGRATIQREISMIQDVLDDLGETCP